MANEHPTAGASDDLASALRGALERGEFFLLYQPTIDLREQAFVGVEALLRWRSATLGVVAPDRFLPDLETSGLIVPVGGWVLETAASQGAAWHEKGHRFAVSVNVAPQQFAGGELVRQVEHAIDASGFPPRRLVLEFSVRTFSDPSSAQVLADLRAIGVRLAIDDLAIVPGAESILREGLVDVVKLDRSSIGDLRSEEGSARIAAIVELAQREHVQTVAQGVEDDDQLLRLAGARVDVGQGFLFSVPHTEAEIDAFLEDYAIFSGRPL